MNMKLSIKTKLILIFIIIILLTLGASSIFSNLFLGKYSIHNNKKNLEKLSQELKTEYINNKDLNLEEISYEQNVKIDILDYDINKNEYPIFQNRSQHTTGNRNRRPSKYNIFKQLSLAQIKNLENGIPVVIEGKHFLGDNKFLILLRKLTEDKYLVISKAIFPISKAVDISRTFFLYSLIFALIIGILIITFMSKKITRPILSLKNITKKISEFDFTQKSDIKSGDELEDLGNNINLLSKELEEKIKQLNKANKKLKKDIKNKEKMAKKQKEFISNISHELKTPIAIIGGYAEGLKDNILENKEDMTFYAETILDETQNMSKLVKELLELSKLENRDMELKKDNFDICNLTKKIVKKYNFLNKDNVNFKIKVQDNFGNPLNKDRINIIGDKNKIEEVIKNYISNAVKNVKKGGLISVLISEKNIKPNNQIRFEVFNSGSKINQKNIEDIWSPFYKVDKSRKREGEGTGLGLAIVKSIIKKHGGKVGVINKKGGVTFWFEI